ncbi:hypothetical protein DV515_00018268, partial [Chloebia gouldiae]
FKSSQVLSCGICGDQGGGVVCGAALLSPQLVYPHDFRLTEKEVTTLRSPSPSFGSSSRGSHWLLVFCRKQASATCPSQTPTQVGDRSVPGGRTGAAGTQPEPPCADCPVLCWVGTRAPRRLPLSHSCVWEQELRRGHFQQKWTPKPLQCPPAMAGTPPTVPGCSSPSVQLWALPGIQGQPQLLWAPGKDFSYGSISLFLPFPLPFPLGFPCFGPSPRPVLDFPVAPSRSAGAIPSWLSPSGLGDTQFSFRLRQAGGSRNSPFQDDGRYNREAPLTLQVGPGPAHTCRGERPRIPWVWGPWGKSSCSLAMGIVRQGRSSTGISFSGQGMGWKVRLDQGTGNGITGGTGSGDRELLGQGMGSQVGLDLGTGNCWERELVRGTPIYFGRWTRNRQTPLGEGTEFGRPQLFWERELKQGHFPLVQPGLGHPRDPGAAPAALGIPAQPGIPHSQDPIHPCSLAVGAIPWVLSLQALSPPLQGLSGVLRFPWSISLSSLAPVVSLPVSPWKALLEGWDGGVGDSAAGLSLTVSFCPSLSLQREAAHYFGYVYFRQVKDSSMRRGYFQKVSAESRIPKSLRLEKPSQPIQSKLCPIPTLSPAQSPECHLQEFLGHLQGWALQTSLGSPCQGLTPFPWGNSCCSRGRSPLSCAGPWGHLSPSSVLSFVPPTSRKTCSAGVRGSLVLVSRLPYVNLFQCLLQLIAPEYFDKLEPCLEAGELGAGVPAWDRGAASGVLQMASFWSKFQQGRPLSCLSKQITRCEGGIAGREGLGLRPFLPGSFHPDLSALGLPQARGMCELGTGNNSLSEWQAELDFPSGDTSLPCIDQWPPPVPGQTLNLPVMGVVIQVPGLCRRRGPVFRGCESLFTPRSPLPFQLHLVAGEVCPKPIPPSHPALLGLQVRIPSRVDKPGSSPGLARREELDPESCWEPFGLGSVWSQQFHSRLSCLASHRALCTQSRCFTHSSPCFSWEFRPCWPFPSGNEGTLPEFVGTGVTLLLHTSGCEPCSSRLLPPPHSSLTATNSLFSLPHPESVASPPAGSVQVRGPSQPSPCWEHRESKGWCRIKHCCAPGLLWGLRPPPQAGEQLLPKAPRGVSQVLPALEVPFPCPSSGIQGCPAVSDTLKPTSIPGNLLRFSKTKSKQPLGSVQAGHEQLEQPWEKDLGVLGPSGQQGRGILPLCPGEIHLQSCPSPGDTAAAPGAAGESPEEAQDGTGWTLRPQLCLVPPDADPHPDALGADAAGGAHGGDGTIPNHVLRDGPGPHQVTPTGCEGLGSMTANSGSFSLPHHSVLLTWAGPEEHSPPSSELCLSTKPQKPGASPDRFSQASPSPWSAPGWGWGWKAGKGPGGAVPAAGHEPRVGRGAGGRRPLGCGSPAVGTAQGRDRPLCWPRVTLPCPGCLAPLRYCCDFRPYFTIHDSEFKDAPVPCRHPGGHPEPPALSLSPPCRPNIVVGVTNPFFIKTLQHWPHILRVGELRVSGELRVPGWLSGELRVPGWLSGELWVAVRECVRGAQGARMAGRGALGGSQGARVSERLQTPALVVLHPPFIPRVLAVHLGCSAHLGTAWLSTGSAAHLLLTAVPTGLGQRRSHHGSAGSDICLFLGSP